MTASDIGIIIIGLITGAMIYQVFNEYRRLPSGKTLPQEIAKLATDDERDRIRKLLRDDEVLHNIWWRIKREDTFPSQDFISDVIYEELKLGGTND